MLQVRDVAASIQWYQRVVGLRSGHGGDEFEMLFAGEEFVLQLHRLDAHEHGASRLRRRARPAPESHCGSSATTKRRSTRVAHARSTGVTLAEEPTWSPLAHHYEAALIDPDGCVVMLGSPFQPDA